MHLAVKSVEVLKSTRPVRALLLKGANRDVQDDNGKTPLSMVGGDHLPETLKQELRHILVNLIYVWCLI